MKIAFDIDEVLCETVRHFLDFIRENKGIEKSFDDVFCYELEQVLDMEKNEVNDIFSEIFSRKDSINNLTLVDGAKKSIEILNKDNDLFFITARPMEYFDETEKFINEKFITKPQLYFSGDMHGDGKTKDKICEDLDINLIIEDNGKMSLNYAKNGLNVLLLDKPWNKEFEHEKICRCFNWDDVLNKIKDIENGKLF